MFRFNPLFQCRMTPCALLPAVLLASGIPAAAAAHLPVPAESFLNYHAANVNELTQEVTIDPQVRTRLAKHFHISGPQMVAYIHKNLVLRPLHKTGVYRVACVRRDGSEYWIESHLPAGTPVFASRATGQPILKLACGNPMVSMLPATQLLHTLPPAQPRIAAVQVKKLADAGINTSPVMTAIDGIQSTLATPDTLTSDDLLAPPVVRVSPSIQLLGGSGLSSVFPALLGAGAAIAVFGHAGSNSTSSPTPAAVPEASTVTSFGLLLLGSGLLVILRRKTPAVNI